LGNVLAVVSDAEVDAAPSVVSATDYYAFGQEMPRRTYASEDYRYGFNGKENDREWGESLIQDYGMRLYNPALCRFLSVDPLTPKYPWYTPYQFAGNMCIIASDLDGTEPDIKTGRISYNYLFTNSANLSNAQISQFMCDFDTNIGDVWNKYSIAGKAITANNSSIFTDNPKLINPKIPTIRVFINRGNGTANATSDNSGPIINLFVQSDWNQQTGMVNNVAGHEPGHLWGLSDRYVEGTRYQNSSDYSNGIRDTRNNSEGRTTTPLALPITNSTDKDYDYLNNLYSTGSPNITPYQLNIVFNMQQEPQWNENIHQTEIGTGGVYRNFDGIDTHGQSNPKKFKYFNTYQELKGNAETSIDNGRTSGNLYYRDSTGEGMKVPKEQKETKGYRNGQ
jgi:RHS repeat-associated protein